MNYTKNKFYMTRIGLILGERQPFKVYTIPLPTYADPDAVAVGELLLQLGGLLLEAIELLLLPVGLLLVTRRTRRVTRRTRRFTRRTRRFTRRTLFAARIRHHPGEKSCCITVM